MGKRTRLRKFFQKLAVVLAVILAVPSTPMPNLNGSRFTEVHAEDLQLELNQEFSTDRSKAILIPSLTQDDNPVQNPTGSLAYYYTTLAVNDDLIDGPDVKWTEIAKEQDASSSYEWKFPEDALGMIVYVKAIYSDGNNGTFQSNLCFIDLKAPDIVGVSEVVKDEVQNTYNFSVMLKDFSPYLPEVGVEETCFALMTPYSTKGYSDISSSDVVNSGVDLCIFQGVACINTSVQDAEGKSTLFAYVTAGESNGVYVFLIVSRDMEGNLSDIVVTAPFSTSGIVYTPDDIQASTGDAEPEYIPGDVEQIPELVLSAIAKDAARKTDVTGYISAATANNSITYNFYQLTDGDGKPAENAVTGPTIKFAGTYEIYLSSTDVGVYFWPGVYGTLYVDKFKPDDPEGNVVLTYAASTTAGKYVVTVDASQILNNDYNLSLEYSFDGGNNYSTNNTFEAVAGTTVTAYVRFASSGNNFEESDPVSKSITLPASGLITYNASDISATQDKNESLIYNGKEQTPTVGLTAIGIDSEKKAAVEEWLKSAIAGKKIELGYKLIKDGNGDSVTKSSIDTTVKAAGTYEIYAASSDEKVVIEQVSLGTLSVAKSSGQITFEEKIPPQITISVSADKTKYLVSVDTSSITNGEGKVFEYCFNGKGDKTDTFSTVASFAEGAGKNVSVQIRFAGTANTVVSAPVSLGTVTTPAASTAPVISSGLYNGNVTVAITPGKSEGVNTSEVELYYATGINSPTINGFGGKGVVSFVINASTPVRAFAVEPGKIMSSVASQIILVNDAQTQNLNNSKVVNVTGILLNRSVANLELNNPDKKTVKVKASITPEGATNTGIIWTVNPVGVVELSARNADKKDPITITAKQEGTATITATSAENPAIKATLKVIVTDPHVWKFNGFKWNKRCTKVSASFTCEHCKGNKAADIKVSVIVRGSGKDMVKARTATIKKDPDGKKLDKAITDTKYLNAKGKEITKAQFDKFLSAVEDTDDDTWNIFYLNEEGYTIPVTDTILTDEDGKVNFVLDKKGRPAASASYYNVEMLESISKDGSVQKELKVTVKDGADRKEAVKTNNTLLSLYVYDEFGDVVGKYEYRLPVTYIVPTIQFQDEAGKRVKNGTIYSAISQNGIIIPQTNRVIVKIKKNSTKKYEPLDLSTLQNIDKLENIFQSKEGNIVSVKQGIKKGELIITSAEKTSKGIINIQLADWSKPVAVSYNISVSKKNLTNLVKNGDKPEKNKTVVLNKNAKKGSGEPIEVEVVFEGLSESAKKDALNATTVKMPENDGGFIVKGIDSNKKLTGSTITIKYPADPANMISESYVYTIAGAKLTVKVVDNSLNSAIKLNKAGDIDLITGQNLIYTPTLNSIDGRISDVSFGEKEDLFDALYNPETNEIIVSVKEGSEDKVKIEKYTRTLNITVGGVVCPCEIKFKPKKTKITYKAVALLFDKSDIVNGTAEGRVSVICTYKKNSVTFNIKPKSVEFNGGVENEKLGKGWYTISAKNSVNVYVKYDAKDGAVIVRSAKSDLKKFPAIKFVMYFNMDNRTVDPASKKGKLSISIDKKK